MKAASTLSNGSVHSEPVETRVLGMSMVLVHGQLDSFKPRSLRLLAKPEGLNRLARGRVREVEQGGQRVAGPNS